MARREKADSTRAALSALSRYKFLFCLPNSVDQHSLKEEYDIVLNDYIRAKNLFGKTEVALFKKVLTEVDIRVAKVRRELHEKIIKMPQSVDTQKKFVKNLLNLEIQQSNLAIADKSKYEDPAWDAIIARSDYLLECFKKTHEQFVSRDDKSLATAGGLKKNNQQNREQSNPPNRVLFCEEIVEIAGNQFPELWRLGQSYFTGDLGGIHEQKSTKFKDIILNAIEVFCNYLRYAVLPPPKMIPGDMKWPSLSQSSSYLFSNWIPQCLKYVRIAYAILIRIDLPSGALDIILKLVDEIRIFCLSSIFKKCLEKVRRLGEKETWEMSVPDFPGATGLVNTK